MRQSRQNVELTNFTEALYAAREAGMERMQRSGLDMGAQGIVGVRVAEGPMCFANHAIGFTAWGTAVRLAADAHRYLRPRWCCPSTTPSSSSRPSRSARAPRWTAARSAGSSTTSVPRLGRAGVVAGARTSPSS